MKPENFPEKNKTYGKPASMTDEECGSLDVFENEQIKISCWKFESSEELLLTILSRKIWLRVFLNIQPPVHLSPEYPFLTEKGEQENLSEVLERLIDRKAKQFLVKKLRETENLTEISVIQSDWLKQFMIDYTNFFAGIDKAVADEKSDS